MRESGLEEKIRKRIRAEGGLCLKWVSPGFTGVPDRIAFLPGGRIFFIEVKHPEKKGDGRTKRQIRVTEQLTDLGFTVIKANSLEDIEPLLTKGGDEHGN